MSRDDPVSCPEDLISNTFRVTDNLGASRSRVEEGESRALKGRSRWRTWSWNCCSSQSVVVMKWLVRGG